MNSYSQSIDIFRYFVMIVHKYAKISGGGNFEPQI